MKKKHVIVAILSIVLVCFISSFFIRGKKEENPDKTIDYLKRLNSYTCDVNIHIKNNKQEIEKYCKQFYNKKYGHKLEMDKNRIFLYRGNDIIVSDLNNDRKYKLDKDFDSIYKLSFIEEYIGLLYTDANIENSFKKVGEREYQLIHLIIPGNNRNINKAVMYVNLENNHPDKIVIYDTKGNEVINYIYKNFVPNAEIGKEIF